jgi:hypothetical protein
MRNVFLNVFNQIILLKYRCYISYNYTQMDGERSAHGENKKCGQIFAGKPEETTSLGVSKNIILKWIL